MARGQHQFRRCGCGGLQQKHIASRTIEQRIENVRRRRRTILAKNTLVGDAAGNLHSRLSRDVAEKTGIIGRDKEFAVGVSNLGRMLDWRRGLRLQQRGAGDADDGNQSNFREALHVFVGRAGATEVIAAPSVAGNQSTAWACMCVAADWLY